MESRSATPELVFVAAERWLVRVAAGPAWALNGLLVLLAQCGPAAAPCASEVLSRGAALAEGPPQLGEGVEEMVARDWWKSDVRLTNLLFTTLRKALAANYAPRDGARLVQVCCDHIRAAFGRQTRFYLQVMADLMLHGGAYGAHDVVLSGLSELLRVAAAHKAAAAVGEHDAAIVAGAVLSAERLLNHCGTGPPAGRIVVAAVEKLVVSDVGGLLLVSQALVRSSFAVAGLLQSLLDGVALHCDHLLNDAASFQQVYVGLISLVSRLSLDAVELWLWDNVLSPHVVSAHMLGLVWAFVVRWSAPLVQMRFLSLFMDCIDAVPARHQCHRRLVALFGSVYMSCSPQVQVDFAVQRSEALQYIPPFPELPQQVKVAASAAISKLAGQLSANPAVVSRLTALCRLGCSELTSAVAAPLAQSVREIYLRVGASSNSVPAREQRAAALLVGSLAMWFGTEEVRKFLSRVLQTRNLSPIANVVFLSRIAYLIDGTCVDVVAALLSSAFCQKHWVGHVAALQTFRSLALECERLDPAMLQQLAGGPKQAETISTYMHLTTHTMQFNFGAQLAAIAENAAVPKQQQLQSSPVVPIAVEDFAGLSMSLVNSVKALHAVKDSEMARSERFQIEVSQCIALLTQIRNAAKK